MEHHQAAEAYRVSHVLSPLDVSSLHMRSRMLLAMGGKENLIEALSEVDKALAMDANFIDLYRVRGKILLAQGQWDAGKADLLRGIVPLGPVTNELWAIYFDAKDAKNGAALADVATKRGAVVRKYGPSAMPFAASSALATGSRKRRLRGHRKRSALVRKVRNTLHTNCTIQPSLRSAMILACRRCMTTLAQVGRNLRPG